MHVLTPKVGAYAQYVGGTDVGVLKIPEHMSFTQAATLGTGIGTAGLALFRSLQIPGWPTRPAEKPQLVLVYGGSTATGTLVIQLLKLWVLFFLFFLLQTPRVYLGDNTHADWRK